MEKKDYIDWRLIVGKIDGSLTAQEEKEFEKWITADQQHALYFERVRKFWQKPENSGSCIDVEKAIADFERYIKQDTLSKMKIFRLPIWRYAAAILIGILLVAGGVFLADYLSETKETFYTEKHDIRPGNNKARIILNDGRVIDLTESTDSLMSLDNEGINISMISGEIVYSQIGETDQSLVFQKEIYNTIIIPRGGEHCIRLTDGTVIWLNSETTLQYPVYFTGNERKVSLEGEAYFKVASDAQKPFIVKTDKATVKVYGTSFNVFAYPDENIHHTTLVEGKISIVKNDQEYLLQPGHQALISDYEKIKIEKVDPRLYYSWIENGLNFENETLEKLMKRLARWYDIDVVFLDESTRELRFTGDMERSSSLTYILNLIEQTARVEFTIKERTVMVKTK